MRLLVTGGAGIHRHEISCTAPYVSDDAIFVLDALTSPAGAVAGPT